MRLHTVKPKSKRLIEQELIATALNYEKSQKQKIGTWIAPQRWDQSAARNTLCEICLMPMSYCSSIDALCSLCNVVAHVNCLTPQQRKNNFRSNWVCDDCISDVNDSKDRFFMDRTKQNFETAAINAQVYIAKTWRRYRFNKLFKILMKSVVRLQGHIVICFSITLTLILRVCPISKPQKHDVGIQEVTDETS
jgi:hypothetical protein